MELNQTDHPQSSRPAPTVAGIVKQWNPARGFGIIFASGGKRYFLHHTNVIDGSPVLGSRVTFEVGPRRSPVDLEAALNVRVGETVGVL